MSIILSRSVIANHTVDYAPCYNRVVCEYYKGVWDHINSYSASQSAAGDNFDFFFNSGKTNLDISYESYMTCQALFSLKKKKRTFRMSSATLFLGA